MGSILAYNQTQSMRHIWEVLNTSIQPLINSDYTIVYVGKYISISKKSNYKTIAEIIGPES